MDALPVCPRCHAPRILAPECPNCGVIYAKAQPRSATPVAEPAPSSSPPLPEPERPPHLPAESAVWQGDAEDARAELNLRTFALPAALIISRLVVASGFGHSLVRIFLSMWVHELGHAVTAWLCGFVAFPLPWFTRIDATRSPVLVLLLAGGLGYGAYRSWKSGRRGWAAACLALLGVQAVFTLLPMERAQALMTFGGDGGCFVLGSALMATFYARRESALYKGWLRWGFLAIGAAAFMDQFSLWWGALSDVDRIPFGENEGVGPSDPTVLTETHGWSVTQLVHRYEWLAAACLLALFVLYVHGLRQARAALRGQGSSSSALRT